VKSQWPDRADGDASLIQYYSRRAREYEEIWHRADPVRQSEQSAIIGVMRKLFRGRRVLEVACGTGYWTALLADSAAHIVAVDASRDMLELARAKRLPRERVEFQEGDAFGLENVPGPFDGGFANFWLSHVSRTRLSEFLAGFHRQLAAGAVVFLADNVAVPGVGGEPVAPAGSVDTFKRRTLADGSEHLVLKNYFTEDDLRRLLAPGGTELRIHIGRCFWWASYVVGR
jgi:SAM-dependent methyltransferase